MKTSRVELLIEQVAPGWAAARAKNRARALAYRQAYEAAETTHLRRQQRDYGSGNTVVSLTGAALRNHEIGRAHVWTPVTNAQLVCRLLLEKKKNERTTT